MSHHRLLDHRLLLLFPFEPAPSAGDDTLSVNDMHDSLAGFEMCGHEVDEALHIYLTNSAHQKLHRARWRLNRDLTCLLPADERGKRPPIEAEVERIELLGPERDLGVLALSLRIAAPRPPGLDQLLDLADTARLRGPLYPGQRRPVWRLDERASGPLESALDNLLPDTRPVFSDLRLFSFSYAALPLDPGPGFRHALCATDPASMTHPPADQVARFFRRQGYRRWEEDGTHWAFTHHGGGLMHVNRRAPTWLNRLLDHQYLDLFFWAVVVAARRRQLSRRLRRGNRPTTAELSAHRRVYEWERFTDQDQGRQLCRLWLEVIERDYGDLARINAL